MSNSEHKKQPMTWEQAVSWLREQEDQQELVRACFFDDPLPEAAERYRQSSEWLAVRALLPSPPGQALDLGAGRGIASYALAKDGWTVTALEPDPSPLVGAGAIRDLARQSALDITIVDGLSESLPFEDGCFDVVHARQVLHHTQDLKAACREIFRVLRPGALFIATREHVVSKHEDKEIFFSRHLLHRLYGGENAFLLSEYLAALKEAGFRIRKVLSPWESEINDLFPDTRDYMFKKIQSKRLFPMPAFVIEALLKYRSRRLKEPGRLYTFLCTR